MERDPSKKLLGMNPAQLGAVAAAESLKEAVTGAYALAERIGFANAYKRKDIGRRALAAIEEK